MYISAWKSTNTLVRFLQQPENEFGYSLNPTLISGSNINSNTYFNFATGSFFQPYITTLGMYNNNYDLIAVAKLAQPLPVSKFTDTTIICNVSLITIALMTVPNLIGLLWLRKEVRSTIKDYWVNFKKEWPNEKTPE